MHYETINTQAKIAELLHEMDGCQPSPFEECIRRQDYVVKSAFFLGKLMPTIVEEIVSQVREDEQERLGTNAALLSCSTMGEAFDRMEQTLAELATARREAEQAQADAARARVAVATEALAALEKLYGNGGDDTYFAVADVLKAIRDATPAAAADSGPAWEKRYAEMLAQRDAALQAAGEAQVERDYLCKVLDAANETTAAAQRIVAASMGDAATWSPTPTAAPKDDDDDPVIRAKLRTMTPKQVYDGIRSNACPTCSSTVGESCHGRTGYGRSHIERRRLFLQSLAAAPDADDLDVHLAEQMADPAFAAAYRAREAAVAPDADSGDTTVCGYGCITWCAIGDACPLDAADSDEAEVTS